MMLFPCQSCHFSNKMLFPIVKMTILHLQGSKYPGVQNVKFLNNKLYPCKNQVTTVLDEGEKEKPCPLRAKDQRAFTTSWCLTGACTCTHHRAQQPRFHCPVSDQRRPTLNHRCQQLQTFRCVWNGRDLHLASSDGRILFLMLLHYKHDMSGPGKSTTDNIIPPKKT